MRRPANSGAAASVRGAKRVAPTRNAAWAGLLAAALLLPLYLWGAAPTVLTGDSAELQTVALTGGVPHPTGYPMFVLCGQLFGRLVPGDPAHRITVMCALAGALSAGLFALALAEFGLSWSALLAGALLYGMSFTLWWASIRTEVYTIAIALFLLALWRTLVALRTRERRDALGATFFIGLALCGHLSFAPGLACLGLLLLARGAPGWPTYLLPLAAAFVLGLSPYLYLAALDAAGSGLNYIRSTIELSAGQFGLTPDALDAPWERLWFLIGGAESRPHDFSAHPRVYAFNLLGGLAHLALFEIGPLGALLAAMGGVALIRRQRWIGGTLAAIAVLTLAAGGLIVDGRLLTVFMMATTLVAALFAAAGLDDVIAWGSIPGPLRPATAVLLVLGVMALPHILRVHAITHPIGPLAYRVEEEGPPHITSFVPQVREYRAARERGERMLFAMPESSFVAAAWDDAMLLQYLQAAEGRRRDLTLDSYYHPWHLARIDRWLASHALATTPLVAVGPLPSLRARLARPDSVGLPDGPTLYIERSGVNTQVP